MNVNADFLYGIGEAVKTLRPNAVFCIVNTNITEWEDPTGSEPPAWSEVMEQLEKDKKLYESIEYARFRKKEYPKAEDQVDELWHLVSSGGKIDQSSNWFQKIKSIKEKYPKPE